MPDSACPLKYSLASDLHMDGALNSMLVVSFCFSSVVRTVCLVFRPENSPGKQPFYEGSWNLLLLSTLGDCGLLVTASLPCFSALYFTLLTHPAPVPRWRFLLAVTS